jgi:hypothetical protein
LQPGTKLDARRAPRIRLEVDVNIYSKKSGLIPGRTLDISESGISVVLPVGLPVGEVVKLEIMSRIEPVMVAAVVRNRNAFRYGLEFEQSGTGRELIKRFP